MKRHLAYGVIAALLAPGILTLAAAAGQDQLQTRDQLQTQDQLQTRDRNQIYGYQLMTPAERQQYREHMRSFKTVRERERYRLEHHREMQERARERGVTIPDEPMPRGRMSPGGMGPGPGGMGPGPGGMGPGPGGMGPGPGGMGPGR